MEITGPLACRLFVSSSTPDADLFLVFRVFSADMREVVFMGAIDPHTPVAQGWLRASHRKLDPKLSTEDRPYHTHDRPRPLEPGEVVQLDVELWPTSLVVPAGHRVGLTARGKDQERQKSTGCRLWSATAVRRCSSRWRSSNIGRKLMPGRRCCRKILAAGPAFAGSRRSS